MQALVDPAQSADLQLLMRVVDPDRPRRSAWATAGSISLHIVGILLLIFLPPFGAGHASRTRSIDLRATPLVVPRELTQKAPNKGKVSHEFELKDLLPPVPIKSRATPESLTRPAAKLPLPAPVVKAAPPAPLPEPPKIEAANQPLPPVSTPQAVRPPQIQTEEKPKLAFETPRAASASNDLKGRGALAPPPTALSDAVRDLARGKQSGGIVVGDLGEGAGGLGGVNATPGPARPASSLELLSDPQGVDFRPYLIQILAAVRRNWFAVMPQSAKMGRQGRVQIQFAVNKDGQVPKLVIASPSGLEALDRAAVAGISASNPFPPLPAEFKGNQVRLQFTFSYNTSRN